MKRAGNICEWVEEESYGLADIQSFKPPQELSHILSRKHSLSMCSRCLCPLYMRAEFFFSPLYFLFYFLCLIFFHWSILDGQRCANLCHCKVTLLSTHIHSISKSFPLKKKKKVATFYELENRYIFLIVKYFQSSF